MMIRSLAWTLAFLLSPLSPFVLGGLAHAKTLYVNNSGSPACSDGTTYASNSSASPWCHIERATRGGLVYASPVSAQAATAGDTVLITAGIYSIGDGYGSIDAEMITNPALAPINNGTAGNYITIRGVGNVYVRMGSAAIHGPMIGCKNNSYIIWDNFQVDDYYGGGRIDAASVSLAASDHCQLLNSTIQGHTGSYFWGQPTYTDNYAAVWLQNVNNLLIKNNRISRMHDNATGSGGQNSAGIMTYDMDDSIIEHNDISDTGQGIIVKGIHGAGQQSNNIIRFNYVHDNQWCGIRTWLSQNTLVYQNVVARSVMGLYNTSVIAGGKNNLTPRFLNNTLYGNPWGQFHAGVEGTDAQFLNNLVIGGTYAIYSTLTAPTDQAVTLNRNFYQGQSGNFALYELRSPSTFNFTTWQAYGAAFDANSSNGVAPSFSNAGGSFLLASDFRLAGGSAALTAGRVTSYLAVSGFSTGDTIPVGAYITGFEQIGIESGNSSSFNSAAGFSGTVRIQ